MTDLEKTANVEPVSSNVLLGELGHPLPPEIKAHYHPNRPHVIELSLSDTITHGEDIPFELWSGRTYEFTPQQLIALRAECDRVLKIAGKQLSA